MAEEHDDDDGGDTEKRARRPHRGRPTTDASQPTRARCTTITDSAAAGTIMVMTRLLASRPIGESGLDASENGSADPPVSQSRISAPPG